MTVLALHRPLVPSPLNPDHKAIPSGPQRAHRKIVISRRSANISPTQRLLRRKASEAFNAHVITTSLAASPAPQPPSSPSPFQSQPQPLRRTAAASSSRPKNAPSHTSSAHALEEELAAMTEPLASFDDPSDGSKAESSYALKTRLVSSSAAAELLSSPLAALLHLLPLPLVSLFVLRFPGSKNSYNPAVTKKERDVAAEDTSFLQDAADLEECRAGEIAGTATVHLPLVLTMRRLMAALGFLCLYALMQFEPLIRRPARSYA
ncbi:hypothetical protein CFIMG_008000RA00001 [Ceratocystis fimbriata CBS 114723]|uniref:Uncharacterized protein n=1 Tax=Ceratocystis fimbriata CBS 114723 TaxID=1035309 RepID=A0A2C5XIH1_9PEZI|nr:hypothetical protein CFIMG_008000RA00001 [Ceratocystis fimbriata CBS 114723]